MYDLNYDWSGCKKLDKNWPESFIDWRVVVRLGGGKKYLLQLTTALRQGCYWVILLHLKS